MGKITSISYKFLITLSRTQVNNKNKNQIIEITTEVLDKNAQPIGEKNFYNFPNNMFLNVWIKRPKANNSIVIPLKNCVSVYDKTVHLKNWSDGAIGYMWCDSNDFQKASTMTALFSSVWGQGHGFYVTPDNLWQSAVVYTVRRVISQTWLNDRDQFLQPTGELTEEFKTDCLIWMLFNGSNLTAGADNLEWNGKKWSLVNHFIPFTEEEVGAPDRFESDFMVQYLTSSPSENVTHTRLDLLSPEAKAVLEEGRKLWRAYFTATDVHSVREELKLNRPDVGWYQVRKALQARNTSGDFMPVSFKAFEEVYKALSEKLRPMVYELGFLRI